MATAVPRAADGSPRPLRDRPTFARAVRARFTHIPGQYTFFDHLATFGQDLVWRPRALWQADRTLRRPPGRVLDLGCGPGDLTFLLAHLYPRARVEGFDFTGAMVRRGEGLRRHRGTDGGRIAFGVADVLAPPFRDATFDLVTSAFLIRNLPDLPRGLREMRRGLRPGGVCVALEITEPAPLWFRPLFHAYFDRVMPKMGALFGTEGPYRYLSDSLRHFPAREAVLRTLRQVGFDRAEADLQSAGSVTTFFAARAA